MARSGDQEQPNVQDSEVNAADMESGSKDQSMSACVGDESPALDEPVAEPTIDEQLAAATQEAEMYKDRFLRARADLENYRKRSVQFITDGVRDGQRLTFASILPVVDNLERAVDYQEQHQTDSVENLLTGVRMTLWQLREALEQQDVKRIAAVGETFDPRFHEAVDVQPAQDDVAADTIVGELQTGYLFGESVLRPAKVRVAQPRQPDEDAEEKS